MQKPAAATPARVLSASAAQAALDLLIPGEVLVRRHGFAHTQLFAGSRGMVALTDQTASRSVCAVRLDQRAFDELSGVTYLLAGDRVLHADDMSIELRRTWRTSVPSLPGPEARVLTELREELERTETGLPVDSALDPASLVGLGAGLTPAGDDLLCGALAAAHAWSDRATVDGLWSGCLPRLGATTDLSAQFLRTAWRGHVAAELRELLLGLSGGRWRRAFDVLTRIGHTSGADLALGVLLMCTNLQNDDEGVLDR